MAKAGYCSGCGGNVWLTADGRCPNGHGSECVSGVYEAGATAPPPVAYPQPVPVSAPPQGKSHTGCVIAVVVAVLLACVACGIVSAIAIPAFNAAKTDAVKQACFANERMIEGAATMYQAEKGKMPKNVSLLVGTYLPKTPVCPGGGTYSWDPKAGRATCSIHGHF